MAIKDYLITFYQPHTKLFLELPVHTEHEPSDRGLFSAPSLIDSDNHSQDMDVISSTIMISFRSRVVGLYELYAEQQLLKKEKIDHGMLVHYIII